MSLRARELFEQGERLRVNMNVHAAIDSYHHAEQAGFDADQCAAARWTCHMLAGKWEKAWRESDAIAARGTPDPHRYWDGTPWNGKNVLIRCLHGLGDTLHFIRYAPLLSSRAQSLTIEAQPKLKELLKCSQLADQVITWGEAEPPWDVQMEVNELPRVFRSLPGTVPNQVPYVCPSSSRGMKIPGVQKLRVGFVWKASSFNPKRNVPLHVLTDLLETTECFFFSLQAGEGWDAPLPAHVMRLGGLDPDIMQTAHLMATLDLIISVDTMAAHLAGAMGLRTWTLLPFQCDWRWMATGSATPWYPTMRLFRQSISGQWAPVIKEAKEALRKLSHDLQKD